VIPNLEQVPPEYHDRLIRVLERSVVDFAYFCKFWFNFTPHEKQRELARPVDFVVMSCGSGVGKSTGGSAFLLWEAWRHEGSAYGCFAPTNAQVKLLAQDISQHILRGDNRFAIFIKRMPSTSDPYLELTNGARIYFQNTAYGAEHSRGLEFNGALMDEAAMDKRETFELVQTRARLKPGWIRLLSTPKGKGGWFFEQAQVASEEMLAADREGRRAKALFIQATAYDNPFYDREILDRRRAATADRFWRQEYMGEFVDLEGGTFRQADLDQVFDRTWEPESEPRTGGLYCHGWDFGRKTTYTVGTTLAFDKLESDWGDVRGIVQDDFRGERWTTVFEHVNAREAKWALNDASSETILDATGIGDVIDQSLDITAEPFIFTNKSRGELILRLVQAVEKPKFLRLPRDWSRLYASMQLHTAKEDAPGQTWDHLDSLGLAYWMAYDRLMIGTPFGRIS
jgi:hypothetical protein